jgi:hypothetical protein
VCGLKNQVEKWPAGTWHLHHDGAPADTLLNRSWQIFDSCPSTTSLFAWSIFSRPISVNSRHNLRVIDKHSSKTGKDDVGSALLLKEVILKGISETKLRVSK